MGKARNGATLRLYRSRTNYGLGAPKNGNAARRRIQRAARAQRQSRAEARKLKWERRQAIEAGVPLVAEDIIDHSSDSE